MKNHLKTEPNPNPQISDTVLLPSLVASLFRLIRSPPVTRGRCLESVPPLERELCLLGRRRGLLATSTSTSTSTNGAWADCGPSVPKSAPAATSQARRMLRCLPRRPTQSAPATSSQARRLLRCLPRRPLLTRRLLRFLPRRPLLSKL